MVRWEEEVNEKNMWGKRKSELEVVGLVGGVRRKEKSRERVREAGRQERQPPSFFLYLLPAW